MDVINTPGWVFIKHVYHQELPVPNTSTLADCFPPSLKTNLFETNVTVLCQYVRMLLSPGFFSEGLPACTCPRLHLPPDGRKEVDPGGLRTRSPPPRRRKPDPYKTGLGSGDSFRRRASPSVQSVNSSGLTTSILEQDFYKGQTSWLTEPL